MLISQRLEQLARQHDDARRVVGVFLIESADRFDQLTMADIAAETYTSKPTLVRVAKQLGYSGWRAFSAAYAREIDRQRQIDSSVDHSLPFGDGAFARDIAHSIAQVRAESTLLTAERLDIADLERACEAGRGGARAGRGASRRPGAGATQAHRAPSRRCRSLRQTARTGVSRLHLHRAPQGVPAAGAARS